jgi:hypothetical protein
MLVDEEGEALQLLRASHAQLHQGTWAELTLASKADIDEALAVLRMHGTAVSLSIATFDAATEHLILEACRCVKRLPRAIAARFCFVTRCVLASALLLCRIIHLLHLQLVATMNQHHPV